MPLPFLGIGGAVARIDVESDPGGAAIGRRYGDAAEHVFPGAEHAGAAKTLRDPRQRGEAPLEDAREPLALFGIVRPRHFLAGGSDHLAEKALVALEQRLHVGRRLRKRRLQRAVELVRDLVVAVFLADRGIDRRVVVTDAGAQIKRARAAVSRGDLVVGVSESRQEERDGEERGEIAGKRHGENDQTEWKWTQRLGRLGMRRVQFPEEIALAAGRLEVTSPKVSINLPPRRPPRAGTSPSPRNWCRPRAARRWGRRICSARSARGVSS